MFKKITLFSFFLVIFVIIISSYNNKTNKNSVVPNVAINLESVIPNLDPMVNTTLTHAFFNNNMYSNLVEVNSKNEYEVGLASSIEWNDKTIIFNFKDVQLANAEDALFSLQRVMLQNTNLHSDLWSIICDKDENRENCYKRVYAENNKLFIKYADENKKHLIIPTLASVDYKIAPKAAFNSEKPESARLVNYQKTTGAYYLDHLNGHYFLVKNNLFKGHLNDIQNFKLVQTNFSNLEDRIAKNEVDIIPGSFHVKKTVVENMQKDWNYFQSHKLSILVVIFANKALEKLSVQQRFTLGKEMANIANSRSSNGVSPTVEYFQDFGQGYLDPEQKLEIEKLRDGALDYTDETLTMGVSNLNIWSDFSKKFPNIKIKLIDMSKPFNQQGLDIFNITNDISFDLNFSLLAYSSKIGLLDMNDSDLETFINLPTEGERIKYINKVHFDTLKKCQIYPIWASPYYTYTRKPLTAELSPFNSRTLLWKIRQ